MLKRILGIILIVIIILIGIGYCSGKKSTQKSESKIEFKNINFSGMNNGYKENSNL
ncbi:hypothetical protein [uncultured Clostridium sp.]|uniref:hypothetical protein n=1 Tax=uncultured Clostridium sp. TaxID=59620 RepID=UPI00260D8C93|nr:hypothetical protein [uncultured Clostridium sp.]